MKEKKDQVEHGVCLLIYTDSAGMKSEKDVTETIFSQNSSHISSQQRSIKTLYIERKIVSCVEQMFVMDSLLPLKHWEDKLV